MTINNRGFSKIETLIIIVIVAALLLLGIALVSTATTNKKVDTFKEETKTIINASKNIYGNLEKIESSYITTSDEAISTGMCITLKGLKDNDYLTNEYKDWEGYLVIEKDLNDKFYYTAHFTNGKYTIDGYSLEKIDDLSLKEGEIEKGNDLTIPTSSFKGVDSSKGGLSKITNYNQKCINEKIE